MATVAGKKKQKMIDFAFGLARLVKSLPASKLVIDYDEEGDMLCINLQDPPRATRTTEVAEGEVIFDFRDKELVSITVLDASKQ